MADIDINELTQARFMGLMCPASSPQSKLLVDDLVDILIKTEQGKRARKADDMAAFRNGVSLIIGNLLIAMEVKDAAWSYHTLATAAFSACREAHQRSTRAPSVEAPS